LFYLKTSAAEKTRAVQASILGSAVSKFFKAG
jgi:hypothetical protein